MASTLPTRPRFSAPVSIDQLADFLDARIVKNDSRQNFVTGITNNTKKIQPGDVYFALPGAKKHGAYYSDKALEAGSQVVVTDSDGEKIIDENFSNSAKNFSLLVVERPRGLMASTAAQVYGTDKNYRGEPFFAVTGTNGKTTTTFFINSLLRALGQNPGLLGTVEISLGQELIPSSLTTPEAPDVHAFINVMKENGADSVSMEVSSHALEFSRVDALNFTVAGFTNLTQDHMDLHGTMDEYFDIKSRLFTPSMTHKAVINFDVPSVESYAYKMFESSTDAGVETYALTYIGETDNASNVDQLRDAVGAQKLWLIDDVLSAGVGYTFNLLSPEGQKYTATVDKAGLFNVANAALALTMVIVSGKYSLEDIHQALTLKPFNQPVPGRMQKVGDNPLTIVDFAHNPEGIRSAILACTALKDVTNSKDVALSGDNNPRMITIIGATGERDTSKRAVMGEIAVEYSDVTIITDDDPHNEDPVTIRKDVMAGAEKKQAELAAQGITRQVFDVEPREEAIRLAIKEIAVSNGQDIVLILGRGHETTQDVKGVDVDIDDRDVAKKFLHQKQQQN